LSSLTHRHNQSKETRNPSDPSLSLFPLGVEEEIAELNEEALDEAVLL
jgi:hypothetical protein